ncbi:MAG: hypothetical protein ACYCZY_10625 [Lacisediminihabitans sp.]
MTTVATHSAHVSSTSLARRAAAGVIGGLAGGLVFGTLMAMMGMLTVIASMVGSNSVWVGFGIHLMISVVFGLGLTVLFGNRLLTGYGKGALVGLGYGAIWWVLGPLMIMPIMLGMPLFAVNPTAALSLMGHMIYGVILALVAVRILKSRA